MARQEIITYIVKSDVSQEVGAEGWEFELLGKKFGIDLLESEWEELKELVEKITPFLEAATDNTPGQVAIDIPAQEAKPKQNIPDSTKVREWAAESGILIDGKTINERGRVPKAWNEAYLAAHVEPADKQDQDQAPEEPTPVTAQPYEEDDADQLDPASLPGRLEDDTDRQTADDK